MLYEIIGEYITNWCLRTVGRVGSLNSKFDCHPHVQVAPGHDNDSSILDGDNQASGVINGPSLVNNTFEWKFMLLYY